MKNATLWIIVLLIVLVGLSWWWYAGKTAPSAANDNGIVAGERDQFADNSKDGAAGGEGVERVTVTYSASGFSPKTLTVPVGTRVTFVNQGAGEMWVASDEHPSHTQYSGTSRESHCPDPGGVAFDQCANSSMFSFVFGKAGTWSYHNHRNAADRGTIVVTE
jgi:plastocyanin